MTVVTCVHNDRVTLKRSPDQGSHVSHHPEPRSTLAMTLLDFLAGPCWGWRRAGVGRGRGTGGRKSSLFFWPHKSQSQCRGQAREHKLRRIFLGIGRCDRVEWGGGGREGREEGKEEGRQTRGHRMEVGCCSSALWLLTNLGKRLPNRSYLQPAKQVLPPHPQLGVLLPPLGRPPGCPNL